MSCSFASTGHWKWWPVNTTIWNSRVVAVVLKRTVNVFFFCCSLIARVKLVGNHNHPTNCAASTKFRPVSEEVRSKFLSLFHDGYTPAKAFRLHLQNLKEEYNDEFHKIQNDRYYCPNMKWVVRLHGAVSKSKCQAACWKQVLSYNRLLLYHFLIQSFTGVVMFGETILG